jgi:DNA-binding response OmpR family regulator
MEAQILLVEDDHMTRQLLASVLEDAGHVVTPAADGAVALRLLEEQRFDVVVTDIRMREIDGVEVLNAARGLSAPPEVILLTGYGSLETAVAALRAGAFNYLIKPCVSTELIECVERAAQRHASHRRRVEAMRIIAQEYISSPHAGPAEAPRALPAISSTAVSASVSAPAPDQRFLQVGALRIDSFRHIATFDGRPLHLTPIEYTLLSCLAEMPGRVLQCAEIVRRTHAYETSEAEAQVLLRAHVRNLRRKLPASYLVTERSTGYMLVDPDEPGMGEV